MCAICMLLSAGPEEGAGAAGTGITGGGELPDRSGGTEPRCSAGAARALNN